MRDFVLSCVGMLVSIYVSVGLHTWQCARVSVFCVCVCVCVCPSVFVC